MTWMFFITFYIQIFVVYHTETRKMAFYNKPIYAYNEFEFVKVIAVV